MNVFTTAFWKNFNFRNIFLYVFFSFFFLGTLNSAALAGTFIAYGPELFTRESGSPVTISNTFNVLNPNTTYTLAVSNGSLEDDIYEKVSSSTISLNGIEVVGSNNFNQKVSSIEEAITVDAINDISIEVRGKPGGAIAVMVTGVDNDPPVITATANPLPNASGWHNQDVTVAFTCSDAISGIDE